MRILVAEDERFLADLVAEGLRERAMAVDVAYDGAGALERLAINEYDVVVLDRDLPRGHGATPRRCRRCWSTPASPWIRHAARRSATAASCRCRARSTPSWRCSCRPAGRSSAPSRSWNGHGTRTPIRSPPSS